MSPEPTSPCEHPDFAATVEVNRLTSTQDGPVDAVIADLRITCAVCNEPFVFIGVDPGLLPSQPMCSVDAQEIHLPIKPRSAAANYGFRVPGFRLTGDVG